MPSSKIRKSHNSFNFVPKSFLIHHPNLLQREAKKSYTCEVCGCEIPIGDLYWTFKPYPRDGYWYGWRKRCINDKPKYYDDIFLYEDPDAKTIQSKKFSLQLKQ